MASSATSLRSPSSAPGPTSSRQPRSPTPAPARGSPPSSPPRSRTIAFSQERQRSAPTEGNLAAGRPARNNPIEPPTKLARGNKGTGGDASGNRLPPHVPPASKTRALEAEEAAALAAGVASTDLQFATTLVRALESGAAQRADEVAAAAAADFETAFARRKAALAAEGNGSVSGSGSGPHDAKHLTKTLRDHAETRRGQLRSLRHALRGDVQALVR